jgi:hypothetical protein
MQANLTAVLRSRHDRAARRPRRHHSSLDSIATLAEHVGTARIGPRGAIVRCNHTGTDSYGSIVATWLRTTMRRWRTEWLSVAVV